MNSNQPSVAPFVRDSEQKITVVHVIFHLTIGGMEKVMIECIRDLTPEFKHVVVSLKTASVKHTSLLPEGVVVHSLGKREGNDWRSWLRMWRIIRNLRADVLHTYNLGTLEYQLIGALSGVKLRVHAEHGRDASDPHGITPRYLFFRKLMRIVVHRWIAVSKDLAGWLHKQINVPLDKIDLIHNGVEICANQLEGVRSRAAVPDWPPQLTEPDCFIIGTVGRLDVVKNQKVLIDAFSKILERVGGISKLAADESARPRVGLVIVGGGVLYEQLADQINRLSLGEYIWLAGPRHDANDVMACFDLFILPSLAEGIPMTLLEAMSMNVPVVASDVGGVSELVTEECGWLVESEPAENIEDRVVEAILDCYTNRPEAAIRAKAARLRVQSEFNQVKMSSQYAAVYNRVGI